jgi:hypothetical protein
VDETELQVKNDTSTTSDNDAQFKPQWFGATLAAATHNSPTIPTDPFPLHLRHAIEPHINKARIRRQQALDAIRKATGEELFDAILENFRRTLAAEIDFCIDSYGGHNERDLLLSALFRSTGLPANTNLSFIHEREKGKFKDRILHALTQNPLPFHEAYDSFVRRVCVPRMVELLERKWPPSSCQKMYYQSFPCLRIVQPDEFSIGPHSDVAYGHHPCSVNFYVPLTKIGGSSSLFLESRPGAEDWHSMEGGFG